MNGNKANNKENLLVGLLLFCGRFFYDLKIKEKSMKVLIGTKNPGKIKGAKDALEKYFDDVEIISVSASSGVSEQPVGKETYIGAKNRVDNLVKYAKENNIDADFYMAVESGIVNDLGFWAITNIAVIKDKNGYESVGTSASFPVPKKYVETVISSSLAPVMDKIFHETDLRSGAGGVGLLTHDQITRIDLNTQAFTMALTSFVNGEIWKDSLNEKIL